MSLAGLVRRARRRAATPQLADAIYCGAWPRFALRRAGFPVGRALLSSFLHALEAAAMALLFDPQYLTALVSARLTLSIASGVLWAGTEGIRRDIRGALGEGELDAAKARLRLAQRRALGGAALVSLVGCGVVFFAPYRLGYFTVVDAYLLAATLRIALSIPVRVLQAGAHAVRRVYRPFWSFLVPDLLDGVSIFLLWRTLGPWSVPVGMVSVGLLKLAISWRYTRGTLRQLKLGDQAQMKSANSPVRTSHGHGSSLLWWVAGAAQTAPSWIVLGLWDEVGDSAQMAATLWVLYAMRPLAALLPRLGGVFYVDLVRARGMGELAERRLLRALRRMLGAAGLSLGLVAALSSEDAFFGAAVLAFFSVNGVFGLEAVRVIAFAAPVRSLLPTLAAFVPATLLLLGATPSVVIGVAAFTFTAGAILLRRAIPRPDSELGPFHGRPVPLLAWLALGGAELTSLLSSQSSQRVARSLAEDPRLRVTRLDRTHLLVFGPPPPSWCVRTAGLIDGALVGPSGSPVEGVLALAQRHSCLRYLAAQLERPARGDVALLEEVRAACPSAALLDASRGIHRGSARDGRDIFREARQSASVSSVRKGTLDVSALWDAGRMVLVSVVPRSTDPKERLALRKLLHSESVARLARSRASRQVGERA